MARKKLGEILIDAGLLDADGLQRALAEQKRWGTGQLGQFLVKLGLVSEENLVRALSKQFNLPAVALDPQRVQEQIVRLIPQDICLQYHLVAFGHDERRRMLDVAMADPASLDAVDHVRIATRLEVRPYFAAVSVIETIISRVFRGVDAPDYESAAIGATLDARVPVFDHLMDGDALAGQEEIELHLETSAPPRQGRASAGVAPAAPPVGNAMPRMAPNVPPRVMTATPQPAAAAARQANVAMPAVDTSLPLGLEQRLADLEALSRLDRARLDALIKLLVMHGMLKEHEARHLGQ